MENLNKWAEDKPLLLAIIAQQLAFGAESCFECAEQIKKKEGFIHNLPNPKLNEWLGLYKQHNRIVTLFTDTFLDSNGFIEASKDTYDFLSEGLQDIKYNGMEHLQAEYEKLSDEDKEEAEEEFQEIKKLVLEEFKKLHDLNIQDMMSDINDQHDEELERRIKRDLHKPEIRELYDAIAKDKGNGDIDTDIPDSPESFAKAIQRERRYWRDIILNN